MSLFYLEFEKPLKRFDDMILSLEAKGNNLSKQDTQSLSTSKMERKNLMENIYSKLTRWERIQLARHPRRPYSLDYINEEAFAQNKKIGIWQGEFIEPYKFRKKKE